jgi:hypothetical protein
MRFSGTVGYAESVETAPGVWKDVITEVSYFGDVIRNSSRREPPSQTPPTLNGNLALENSFSIVGDAVAYENFAQMRYVNWNGKRWEVTNVEDRRPRLILTVGGLWNGDTP